MRKQNSSASSRRKRIAREEKPANFERVTLEFNTIYNEFLAFVRDRNKKAAHERYLNLYNAYLEINKENLQKSQKEILETRIKDASSIVQLRKSFFK